MSREKYMSRRVMIALRSLDPVRVENPALPGTPDINFIGGWLELKSMDAWPKRPSTPLKVPHFTQQQRVWLLRRVRAGGCACVLLRVGGKVDGEWLLFAGDVAALNLGGVVRSELYALALKTWRGTLIDSELVTLLREGSPC
jgi:hypothetical protein